MENRENKEVSQEWKNLREKLNRKTMRIGTIKTYGGRGASIYIQVHTSDTYNTPEHQSLSITGCIGPLPSGNSLGGCGQIDMKFAHRNSVDNDSRYEHPTKPSEIKFVNGWTANKWFDLLDIWKQWHLKSPITQVPIEVFQKLDSFPNTDKEPAWV